MTELSSAAHAAAHGTVCPSCGRFVGAFDRCPYCGTGVVKRIPLRVVRLAALGVALSGMVCLHLMAVHRETPTIGIADITPAMNYAFRSVVGRAARPLTYHRDGGRPTGIALVVEDGSGDLFVRGFRQVAEALDEKGIVVRKGDTVKVTGTIRVVDDSCSMVLSSPDLLVIAASNMPVAVPLDAVARLDEGAAVLAQARIVRIEVPRAGNAPIQIEIEDASGSATLVAWPDVFTRLSDQAEVKEGALIRARATVGKHRGVPQLQLDDERDFELVASASTSDAAPVVPGVNAASMKLCEVTGKDKGKTVAVAAAIAAVRMPRAGSRAPCVVTLDDGSARMHLVFWAAILGKVTNAAPLVEGTRVEVEALVTEYRGTVQLELKDAAKLRVTAPAGTPAGTEQAEPGAVPSNAPPAVADPAAVAPAGQPMSVVCSMPTGTVVAISGTVGEVVQPTTERAPVTLTLSDGSNEVRVVLWPAVWNKLPEQSRPVQGGKLRVTGVVGEYRSQRELRVNRADDLQQVAP